MRLLPPYPLPLLLAPRPALLSHTFPTADACLREVNTLLLIRHPNVVSSALPKRRRRQHACCFSLAQQPVTQEKKERTYESPFG